jgi:hypothetical protein
MGSIVECSECASTMFFQPAELMSVFSMYAERSITFGYIANYETAERASDEQLRDRLELLLALLPTLT